MIWTIGGVKMNGARPWRPWLTTVSLHLLILTASCAKPHRRSMASQQTLPLSKGGWRPVIGQSGGLLFGYNTAPLHAPQYKIPVPVLDYPTSQRPHPTRDAGRLTSIAQAYRPTTLRTVPVPQVPAASQPVNSYLNPFSLPNNLAHYKFVQNFPVENVVIRNPHNPFGARPMFKYPTKYKQQQFPNQYQQLMTVQPIQFGQYQTAKPLDFYGKPFDNYAKPMGQKQQTGNTEIYKTEVYKLQDSDTAPAINQQVKTAQQSLSSSKVPASPYPQFAFSEQILPANIFGSFGSFGVQSVKGRDPQFPAKTTYLPPSPSKQTIFNSFSFAPNFKMTPQFATTTPKLQTTPKQVNQIHYGSSLTWNDYKNIPTQATKLPAAPAKVDPNLNKGTFKPSPQDPFIKHFKIQDYKVSTYNPTVQTSTFAYSTFHPAEYTPLGNSQHQQHSQINNYNKQQYVNINNENKKTKIHDSVPAGVNQQASQQYASPPKKSQQEGTPNSPPYHATYEVTENNNDDSVTHPTPVSWPVTPETYKSTENSVTKPDYLDYNRPTTLPYPEEFAIITEAHHDEGYDNSLSYDNPVESQSRRPSGDEFEPIGKHKLKEYYYKVSTAAPSYEDQIGRRTKKPSEKKTHEATQSTANKDSNEVTLDALPTLPPNRHFKRPNAPEPVNKDKIRKRNKLRRRRPQGGNNNKEGNTRKYSSTTETHTTIESHTIRPRARPNQSKQNGNTTPTISIDQTTSAVPTVSPTIPTTIKKKLINRRPYTTTERLETASNRDHESNKESPIMKISAAARVQHSKPSTTPYEYKTDQTPDYSHKQDEKDTPTSDIAVSLNEFKTIKAEAQQAFSFHRDLKPIEPKQETGKETTTEDSSEDLNEVTTTAKTETTQSSVKNLRPRIKTKYDRPRFSVKDYRNRLSSTTSTEKPPETPTVPKIRYPHRRIPTGDNKASESENTTERKKFTTKEQKQNASRTETDTDRETYSVRPIRMRITTAEPEVTTQKVSSRIRNGSRRPRPTEETTESSSRRPLRKKIKDSDLGVSVHDVALETTASTKGETTTSERTRSESAIMKIADKKHHDHAQHNFEHSKRVSDLTLAASKDYNTPGMFKTVSSNSRRIPNYFTIATDDPILPIEAFFPQINNQKKES